jgi:DNA-binding CsgD family transcriptional regulator
LRGRSAELDTALQAVRAARDGRPSIVLVRGEPGIGKTAFVEAVIARAGPLGLTTAYAAANPDDRVAPLSSLGPVLRFGTSPLIGSADFMDLASLHEQPLWLAERLATLLEQRASDKPVLLAVDDAQWCDPMTGFVLRVLPKRLAAAPIAWVLATRPVPGGGPAENFAVAARTALPVVQVELAPLTDDAVFAVAVDRLGDRPAPAVLHRLASARGNPFLTVQLLDGLFEPGGEQHGAGQPGIEQIGPEQTVAGHVPAGLRDGVRHRVGAASPQCRELLRTAAVLGPVFPLGDVAGLLGVPSARLTEPLVEAITAGFLTDEGSVVRFRHELLREAVYDDLPPSGRRALHRGIAEHLLAAGRGCAAAAPHVLATAEPGDTAAADVLRRAAHEILDTMSTTSATFIRQAFELTRPDDPAWGEIGADMVAILLRAHQFDDAFELTGTLLAAPVPDELAARVRLLLLPRLWATGRSAELAALAREPCTLPALGARLAAYRALAEGDRSDGDTSDGDTSDGDTSDGDTSDGDTDKGRAESTDEGSDQVAAILATIAAAERAGRAGDYVRTHELFASARAAAQETDGHGLPEVGQLAVRELLALARRDDIDGALAGLDDGARFPDSWQAAQVAFLRARLTFGAGRLDDAASAARDAAALKDELGDVTFEPELRLLTALIALLRGDTAGVRGALAAGQAAGEELPLVRALLADSQGDPRAAAEVVARVGTARASTGLASTGLVSTGEGLGWPEDLLAAAACSARHTDDTETVRAAAELLAERARRNPDVASVTGAWLLAEALTTNDFKPAVAQLRRSPRALLAARAEEEFGRFLLGAGDRATAVGILDGARDRYAELGAVPAATRVQRILRAAGARRRRWAPVAARPHSGWEALTDMERRVALLVAGGHTNRAAADELLLSPSTVSTHLRAVFTKLGVHSRVQLAHVVLRGDGTQARRP